MPPKRPKPRQNDDRRAKCARSSEARTAEVITIAWTVSVTGAVVADLMFAAANLFARGQPAGHPSRMLEAILLLLASGMGAVSLALLAATWRVRQVKPPRGYLVFAALVATAPIAVLVGRFL
jgi:hypothetical protein